MANEVFRDVPPYTPKHNISKGLGHLLSEEAVNAPRATGLELTLAVIVTLAPRIASKRLCFQFW